MRSPPEILSQAQVIAVVGASRDPRKAAHSVPLQMLRHGWRIIAVNPFVDQLFGERCYPSLVDLDEPVDLVNVFRPAAETAQVVRQAAEIKAPAVWLQSGIVSLEARRVALAAGMDYVEDRCLAVERALAGLTRRS